MAERVISTLSLSDAEAVAREIRRLRRKVEALEAAVRMPLPGWVLKAVPVTGGEGFALLHVPSGAMTVVASAPA